MGLLHISTCELPYDVVLIYDSDHFLILVPMPLNPSKGKVATANGILSATRRLPGQPSREGNIIRMVVLGHITLHK